MTELTVGLPGNFLTAELQRQSPRCPECGSFFDAPRVDPKSGTIARKCMACQEWHPLISLRWEGSD
jgi:hypothetical protein